MFLNQHLFTITKRNLLPFIILHLLNLINSQQMTMPHESTDPINGYANSMAHSKLDADAILVQRRNFALTTYHLLDETNGHPIFTRPLHDRGKKFIFFNNPSFPAGSGHYIILRKMEGQNKDAGYAPGVKTTKGNAFNQMPQFLYETFTLSFKDSLTGSVTDLDPMEYNRVRLRAGKRLRMPNQFGGTTGGKPRNRLLPGPFRRIRGKRDIAEQESKLATIGSNTTLKLKNGQNSNLTMTVSPFKQCQ